MTTLSTVEDNLKDLLEDAAKLKTGERTEEQRMIAILCTKIEDAYAWARYAWSNTE